MWEMLGYAGILILSLIGCAAVLRWCFLRILLPRERLPFYALVPVDSGNAEYRLRTAAEAVSMTNPHLFREILAVDMGLEDEEKQVCLRLAQQYKCITLCELNDLEDLVWQLHLLEDD